MIDMLDKIEKRRVASLIPNARNARLHSDAQVQQIANSMKEFGWTIPILIDEHDGIIAGHGRILAAHLLDLEYAPCLIATNWSEDQKRAYMLADNKLSLNATWDFELLMDELKILDEHQFDTSIIGFTNDELEQLKMPENLADEHWQSMPDFENPKGAWHSIIVHFKSPEDMMAFARMIDQPITPKTKFIWHPKSEEERWVDQQYRSTRGDDDDQSISLKEIVP